MPKLDPSPSLRPTRARLDWLKSNPAQTARSEPKKITGIGCGHRGWERKIRAGVPRGLARGVGASPHQVWAPRPGREIGAEGRLRGGGEGVSSAFARARNGDRSEGVSSASAGVEVGH